MSAEKEEISQSTSGSDEGNTSSSGFIDDYSHLRLSYYQYRGAISDFSDMSYETAKDMSSEETFETAVTSLTEISTVEKDEERQKRRDYVSRIPELKHPSYVVASIISSASRKINSLVISEANVPLGFRYNERIELGSKVRDSQDDMVFDPQRRSTLKPDQFPIDKRFM